ncbi:hypothetical protein B7H19_10280 [Pseudomonas putida]|nr:hypothetical protein B7H19_10280 [Pseudomonas putida]
MSDKSGIKLNRAALAVVLERQRQVSDEGYSLYRDDGYIKGELARAASVYARLAGQPGTMSTDWPWAPDTFKPSADRQRDLVKAGALILAEIERLDRQGLIRPAVVRRDEYGMFQHPDLPDFDEGDGEKCKAWIAQQGLQLIMVHLETDAPEEIADRYFQSDEPHCGYWEPGKPDGDGWFCLAIHDTDDGPVCWWGRRVVTP